MAATWLNKEEYSNEQSKKRQTRNYTFTWNNYDEDSVDYLYNIFQDYNGRYLVIGFEVAPTTGTSHLQCYITFKTAMRLARIKKLLPRCHIEESKGSPTQNRTYCLDIKDDKIRNPYLEFGDLPQKGKRNDMNEIVDMIKENVPMNEIIMKYPGQVARYYRGFQYIQNELVKPRDENEKPVCYWYYGCGGSGKTKTAKALCGEPGNYYIKDNSQWWDRYKQQEVIIIDDMNETYDFRALLRLMDYGPFQGQVKGGYVQVNSPYVVVTCDKSPRDLYSKLSSTEICQLLRRLNDLKHFKGIDASTKTDTESEEDNT